MPIPKGFAKKYGIIMATCQKRGDSREEAKRKAEKAMRDWEKKEGKK